MPKYWLVVGKPKNWRTAFAHGNIWGLRASQKIMWDRISKDDIALFYATSPVSGVIGYGTVRTKFRQDKPLWPQEVEENKVIWPYRFEFNPIYCLPFEKWKTDKISVNELKKLVRGGFQQISYELANSVIERVKPAKPPLKKPRMLHEEIKSKVAEIGALQGFIVEPEYLMDKEKLDVTWRRVERGVPTYVFEVQIGGDIYHALAKLKHAHDLWNSNIYLITTEKLLKEVNRHLSGTFHEIKREIKVIEIEQIEELFKRKKAYKELERQLGL